MSDNVKIQVGSVSRCALRKYMMGFLNVEIGGGIALELEKQSNPTQKPWYLWSHLWAKDKKLENTDIVGWFYG